MGEIKESKCFESNLVRYSQNFDYKTHRNHKNRPIIVKFVRYVDRRCAFSNKKKLKGKNMSITESLTKIRMSALKEERNKFGYSSVWTAGGKIMYKEEGDTKAKVYYD